MVILLALLSLLWFAAPAEATACNLTSGSPGSAVYTCVDTGNAITNGGNFADTIAFASAIACGDTVILPHGAIFSPSGVGPGGQNSFTAWRNCSPPNYITIQGDALGSLPAGHRVSYADFGNMPVLRGISSDATWTYNVGAGGYRLIGIAITTGNGCAANPGGCTTTTGGGNYFAPVLVMHNYQDNAPTMHDVVYDRIIVCPFEDCPTETFSNRRSAGVGIRMDGQNNTLTNSVVDGFCCLQTTADFPPSPTVSQSTGIEMLSGNGPFTVTNNLIGAYGWNIFTGGSGSAPTNTSTMSSLTHTSAVFASTAGLNIGSVLRMFFTTPLTNNTDPSNTCLTNSGGAIHYGVAKVTNIVSSTVTWAWICNAGGTMCPTGGENPDSPGEAGWRTFARLTGFTVTRNTFNKRAAWSGNSGQCKSFWEVKEGDNILFDGNTLTGPIDNASGDYCPINNAFATPQNDTNPWAETNFNVFSNNLMYGVRSNFGMGAYDSYCALDPATSSHDNSWVNNLLFTGANRVSSLVENIQNANNGLIAHNTVIQAGNSITKNGYAPGLGDSNNLVIRDNIVSGGNSYFNPITVMPGLNTNHNIVVDGSGGGCAASPGPSNCNGWTLGTGDHVVANNAAVGFVNLTDASAIDGFGAGGNYHSFKLQCPGSIGCGAASDTKDIGVDFTALDAALGGGGVTGSGLSITGPISITGAVQSQ